MRGAKYIFCKPPVLVNVEIACDLLWDKWVILRLSTQMERFMVPAFACAVLLAIKKQVNKFLSLINKSLLISKVRKVKLVSSAIIEKCCGSGCCCFNNKSPLCQQ